MKNVKVVFNVFIYSVLIFFLAASIGTAVTGKPFLMTVIRSNSMYPVLQRGDLVFLRQLDSGDPVNIDDIIVFRTEEGTLASAGWICHRVVSRSVAGGYITKGDANKYTDQDTGDAEPIKREWIEGCVITVKGHPFKLPLLGYLALWLENFRENSYMLPVIIVILAVIIVIGEIHDVRKKRKEKNEKYELFLMYFLGGLIVFIMIGTSILGISEHVNLVYEVSDANRGVIMGSSIGVLKVGDTIEQPLTELENKGFFPIVATITTRDPQITFSHNKISLKPGEQVNATMTVNAVAAGEYKSEIRIGMFLPLLPSGVIFRLAEISFWLALVIVSLIPALPFMLYPIFERRLRRNMAKEIRRRFRRIKKRLLLAG
ncbi:MAG: signal peptidase I [Clostridiales bacterium]|nr:signal peptidase I [Clostridiales bacterium]